jgi:hypothetical protein
MKQQGHMEYRRIEIAQRWGSQVDSRPIDQPRGGERGRERRNEGENGKETKEALTRVLAVRREFQVKSDAYQVRWEPEEQGK